MWRSSRVQVNWNSWFDHKDHQRKVVKQNSWFGHNSETQIIRHALGVKWNSGFDPIRDRSRIVKPLTKVNMKKGLIAAAWKLNHICRIKQTTNEKARSPKLPEWLSVLRNDYWIFFLMDQVSMIFHKSSLNRTSQPFPNKTQIKALLKTLTRHWMVINILNCKCAWVDPNSLLVWNFQFELFLESHYNLNIV